MRCSLALALALCSPVSALSQQALRLNQGRLILEREGKQILLKSFNADSEPQGFALCRNGQVFVAHFDPESGEAATLLVVIDPASRKETPLGEIGGTGESSFVYEPSSQLVLFNWVHGLYVFSLPSAVENASSGKARKDFELLLTKVSDSSCDRPDWESPSVARCVQLSADGTSSVLRVPLSGLSLAKSHSSRPPA